MVSVNEKTALIEMVKAFAKTENLLVIYRVNSYDKTFVSFEFFYTVTSQQYTNKVIWGDVENIFACFETIREQVMAWKEYINNVSKPHEVMTDAWPNPFTLEKERQRIVATYSPFNERMTKMLKDRIIECCKNEGLKPTPKIKKVHFSGPCTIVLWTDNTKTIVRAENEVFDPEKGLAMAIAKKVLGTNASGSNYYDEFKKWCEPYYEAEDNLEGVEITTLAEAFCRVAEREPKNFRLCKETFKVSEIANLLNVTKETVRRWTRSGQLKATMASNKTGLIINGKDLFDFIQTKPTYKKQFNEIEYTEVKE